MFKFLKKMDRYTLSLIALAAVVLGRSYATSATPFMVCVGQNSYNKAHPSEIVDEAKMVLVATRENRSDLIPQGKAVLTLCRMDDIEVNNGRFMVMPDLNPGKNSTVFSSLRNESLEIKRWIKKDAFEAIYEAPATIGNREPIVNINMTCHVVKSFPKNLCSL